MGSNGTFNAPMSGGTTTIAGGGMSVFSCEDGGTGSGQVEISLDTGFANTSVAVLVHLRHATLNPSFGSSYNNEGTSTNPVTTGTGSHDGYLQGWVLTAEAGNGPDGTWNNSFTAGTTRGNGAASALRISEGYRMLGTPTSVELSKTISVSQVWGAILNEVGAS